MVVTQLIFLPYLFVLARVPDLKTSGKGFDLHQLNRKTRSTPEDESQTTKVIQHLHKKERQVSKTSFKDLGTYAQLSEDPKGSFPSTFTICSAVMREEGTDQVFFSLLGRDGTFFAQAIIQSTHPEHKKSTFYYFIKDHAFSPNMSIPIVFPFEWTHSCMALSTESGLVRWVVDGFVIEDTSQDILKEGLEDNPTDFSGKTLLGVIHAPRGWFEMSHKTSSMNIFSSALSIEKMRAITKAKGCGEEGDYLAWSESKWTLHGEAVEIEDQDELCQEKSNFGFYSASFPEMSTCMQHCEKLKSRSPSVVTMDDWLRVKHFATRELYNKGHNPQIWISVTDEENEGVWKDYFNDEVMTHKGPFTGEGPNGGSQENCASQVSENHWVDWYCVSPSAPSACICDQNGRRYLRLRGLCSKSKIDFLYIPVNNKENISKLVFRSSEKNTVEYDPTQKIWSLETNSITSSVSASTEASHISYALGKHSWLIRNDSYECSRGEPYQLELKLTGCNLGEFTCDDGQCIGMTQRCDQVFDCSDESDEVNCKILVLKKSYRKSSPPVLAIWRRHERQVFPATIRVNITLLDIASIRERDNEIDIKFMAEFEWFEPRAKYHNLKEKMTENPLELEDIKSLWTPKLVYRNNKNNDDTIDAALENSQVYVQRRGGFVESPLSSMDEIEIFEGEENPLTMIQSYTKDFKCVYDMATFPFDTQVIMPKKWFNYCLHRSATSLLLLMTLKRKVFI